jgi:hypothetical protein
LNGTGLPINPMKAVELFQKGIDSLQFTSPNSLPHNAVYQVLIWVIHHPFIISPVTTAMALLASVSISTRRPSCSCAVLI